MDATKLRRERCRMNRKAILFDGDDTLWMTQPIYKSVIDNFYTLIAQQGLDVVTAHKLFELNNERLLKTIKLSTERLGQAMSETYETLCNMTKISVQQAISGELIELAKQVFIQAPQPLDGLHETLSALSKDFDLFFYSGGAVTTQRDRLSKLNLNKYFDNRLFIVHQKDDSTLAAILTEQNLHPTTTWIVGNSLRFEINPGKRLGLNCIWMHTNFWKLDLEDVFNETFVAFTLHEVSEIISHSSGFTRDYRPSATEALELRSMLASFSNYNDVWVVGTSPKLDINPASGYGAKLIWIPAAFSSSDIEPFNSSVFIAFSKESAEEIIDKWPRGSTKTAKVIWRIHRPQGDLGGSIVVD